MKKPKFIQCEHCKSNISQEECEFATYHTVIDGQEYLYCCKACAEKHRKVEK